MEFVHKPFVAESDPSTSCNSMQHYIYTHTRTPPFNGPFSGTTRVSRYQKGKTNLDFTEAREWVAVASAGPYASLHLAPDRCQYPTTHVFYRPDALPAAQPTASKHWRHMLQQYYTTALYRLYTNSWTLFNWPTFPSLLWMRLSNRLQKNSVIARVGFLTHWIHVSMVSKQCQSTDRKWLYTALCSHLRCSLPPQLSRIFGTHCLHYTQALTIIAATAAACCYAKQCCYDVTVVTTSALQTKFLASLCTLYNYKLYSASNHLAKLLPLAGNLYWLPWTIKVIDGDNC